MNLRDMIKSSVEASVKKVEETVGKPAGSVSEYFKLVRPTFIENWPRELCNMSIAQVDLPFDIEDTKRLESLVRNTWSTLERGVQPEVGEFGGALSGKLDSAIKIFPRGGFVRLGSRSPKDSMIFYETKGRCLDGAGALALLTCFSERIINDLWTALEHSYPVHLFVREWTDIEPWSEFRCFMRERRLVGISQYNYLNGEIFSEIAAYESSIRWAIEVFFERFRKASHLDDVVFDVFLLKRTLGNQTSWKVKLLEINPFFQGTDPCLFDHRNCGDFDGSFRYNRK